jgi:two-component system NtrC family sensor kinase
MPNPADRTPYLDPSVHSEGYYRELQRKNVLRLVLTYLAPLILLSTYFYFQYRSILQESTRNHLRTVAENHARTMDLFLQERIVNLSNLIDDPKLRIPPPSSAMRDLLRRLLQASDTFEDIGFIDSRGIQVGYAGPYPELDGKDYSREPWFAALKNRKDNCMVTDSYLGFRQKAHFTLAVSRIIDDQYVVLRAALDSEKLQHYLSSLPETHEVDVSIVNAAGHYQLADPGAKTAPLGSAIVPPLSPRLATVTAQIGGKTVPYAYAWLRTCDWALIAKQSAGAGAARSGNAQINIIAFSAAIIALIFSVIVVRAKKIVQTIRRADATRAQLSDNLLHASKLAAVGELASGIAHEINNPLAIINEEVGLIKDMADPRFNLDVSLQDLTPHLDSIQEAVFRCRDITSKLMAFVRRTEISVRAYNIHELIDGVVNSFYGPEMAVSNIEIVRSYCREELFVLADKTQLEQVFLNLMNNAIDAIGGRGRIAITTTLLWDDDRVRIDVADTGTGMTQDQLERIFMPFYTTKQAGEGTGLGLSISYAIIKGLGGEISVSSTPGQGSTFSIVLPIHMHARTSEATVRAEQLGSGQKAGSNQA